MNKIQKSCVIIALFLLISFGVVLHPTRGVNTSSEDISWEVSAGEKFEWRVTESNGSDFYFPLDSVFQMEIKSITSPGPSASQINVTFTAYNSSIQETEILIDGDQYVFFNHSSGDLNTARGKFTDAGFIVPSNYVITFADALNETYESHSKFNGSSYVISEGFLKEFHSYSETRDHYLSWYFTENGLTDKFEVIHDGEVIYRVELTTDSSNSDEEPDKMLTPELILLIVIVIGVIGVGSAGGVVFYLKKKERI